ncbi:MAG: LmeA family phospholipid-binding protein [Actinomycetota bacterium]
MEPIPIPGEGAPPPRRRRRGRILVAVAITFVAVLAAIDFGLRFWTESWLSSVIQNSLGLPAQPDLNLGGTPFTYQVVREEFSSVSIDVGGLAAGGLEFETVALDLEDVRFEIGDLLSGDTDTVVVAGGGGGRAEVSDIAFTAFLQQQGNPIEVEFLGPRVRTTTSVAVGTNQAVATGLGTLRLEGSSLVFDPDRVKIEGNITISEEALAFSVPLPPVLDGVAYESITVTDSLAVLTVNISETLLQV